jgi:uncharacterized protein (DUF362 family)/NAD-dependent dihydropyrimidine dehydrogenase PreA subunit
MNKVSIVKCEEYNLEDVREAIEKAFDNIGGLKAFVKPNDNVLLKVNLLSARKPEKAVTTHPVVVEAMATAILDLGATPMIGDSPGGAIKGVRRYWEKSGMLDVSETLDIELVNFETSGTYEFKADGRTLNLATPIFDADLVINMPKLKTHGLTLMTGAVKNMYGAIPGLRKAIYHKENPVPLNFAKLLVDVYTICQPKLTLMDAIIGMEGQGPASGNPRKIGVLLAGSDGFAVDSVAAKIIGYAPEEIDTLSLAEARGLIKIDDVEVVGEPLDDVKIEDFDLTGHRRIWKMARLAMHLFGEIAVKILDKYFWIRPTANEEGCTRCQFCIKSCPVSAMRLEDNTVVIDYDKCINCLCCHELCPENAIEIESSRLASHFR